ncbi:MFS transporter [bacterium NHP-B]|nr:MFS transporter [bacterium NHP-B]
MNKMSRVAVPMVAKKRLVYGWYVWGLGTAFYLYQFILRASPSVMADHLMSTFMIQASSLGVLTSFYYYAYSTLQIPIGILLDKWGPNRVIHSAILVCIVGTILFALAPTFSLACIGRILIGAGASGAFLSTITLARTWLPEAKVAFAVGTTITFGKLGGILSGAPLASLIQVSSWRTSLIFLFFVGLIIALLIWTTLKNPVHTQHTLSKIPIKKKILFVFRNKDIWSIGLYGCFMYVPLSVFTDIWGVSFLMKYYCISKGVASLGIGILFIGTGFGAPLVALLSDKMKRRKPVMTLSALASFIVCSYLMFADNIPLAGGFVLLFLVGFFMTGQTLVFTVGAEIVSHNVKGVTTGFVNTIVMIGGVVFQPCVGFILDSMWDGRIQNGVPFYTLENYKIALGLIPVCMFCALITLVFMPETHPGSGRRGRVANPETDDRL